MLNGAMSNAETIHASKLNPLMHNEGKDCSILTQRS
jgi:hypothetical protein